MTHSLPILCSLPTYLTQPPTYPALPCLRTIMRTAAMLSRNGTLPANVCEWERGTMEYFSINRAAQGIGITTRALEKWLSDAHISPTPGEEIGLDKRGRY